MYAPPIPKPARPVPVGKGPVQRLAGPMATAAHAAAAAVPFGPAAHGGLPGPLRAGMERLSGVALDDVRVYRNSFKPARLQAHAFAQGNEIHLGPGQDRHLPHEAWHVVQQRQGRVPITGRIGGTALNDDAGLEAEADRMSQTATTGSVAVPMARPAQRVAAASDAPAQLARARTHDDALWQKNMFRFGKVTNWIRLANDLEAEIVTVGENIEDYTDGTKSEITRHRKILRKIETGLNDAIDDGNTLMGEIDNDNAAFLGAEDELHAIYARIRNLFADFQDVFLPAGSGFSASARSTPIDNVTITRDKKTQNAPFLRDTTIGGRTFGRYKVAKPVTAPDPGKIVLRSGSTYYDDDDFDVGDDLPAYDHNLFKDPRASTHKTGSKFFPKKRDTTQDGAMNGVSARTYAWMSNTPGWNTQKWEWLHLRAASLGGATHAQNLVLGTRDANTHMMPFESNLVRTAHYLSGTPRYQGITVDWTFEGQDPMFKYKVRKITIKWVVHLAGHGANLGGQVTIYPLEDKAVLSRTETEFIEQALSDERETLYGHATVPLPKAASSGGGNGKSAKKKQKIK